MQRVQLVHQLLVQQDLLDLLALQAVQRDQLVQRVLLARLVRKETPAFAVQLAQQVLLVRLLLSQDLRAQLVQLDQQAHKV